MKNQAKLKDLGLEGRERYYRIKFGKGAKNIPDGYLGIATVCLLPVPACEGRAILRGIAFCSPLDRFLSKLGRDRSLGRAIKALERGEDSEATPEVAAPLLRENMLFLSAFNPELTDFELGLVKAMEARVAY